MATLTARLSEQAGRARPGRVVVALFALAAYLPPLVTRPGWVSADTKSYLTIDPGRLMRRAASMWDPWVGAGTITHQNIGYLFPLGPYYWLAERVGIPDWVAQRLLWGTLVFAALTGTWRLCRWLGWSIAPAVVAACAYGFSPYLLSYLARLSVLLGPWAALPWLIRYLGLSVRERGWRWPARFVLVVALVGSTNATALLLVGVGPLIWLVADVVGGRVRARWWASIIGVAIGCVGVSAWWIQGLRIQGTYGLPILRYTETYETVATAATPTEVVRGLGYWFFYGGDKLDAWVGASPRYLSSIWLIALGFVIATCSLAGLLVAAHGRGRAVVMGLVGLALSVGAPPWGATSPYGWLFGRFVETTPGMAMRSTPRAVPLVALALALGLGAGAQFGARWLARHRPTIRPMLVPAVAVAAVVLQLFPWFGACALTPSILRPEHLPGYELSLAEHLNTTGTSRVYELPGADFANYRWGGTVDPVLPGLLDRPYLAREQVPQGAPATADLLGAIERRYSEGWFEPASLGAIADLLGAGTVVVRNDLEYERYRLARPGLLWPQIDDEFGPPSFEGPIIEPETKIPMIDEADYAHAATTQYPAVAAYDLDADQPIVTLKSASAPMVVAGDGDGLVDLAAVGMLDTQRIVIPAAGDPAAVAAAVAQGDAWMVITDTNRARARRWSSIGSNVGALETADQQPVADPTDNRLDVYPNDDPSQRTVLEPTGMLAAITASGYGNQFVYTPEDAPASAIDGDVSTAWRAAVFQPVDGVFFDLTLRDTVTATSIQLTQPLTGVTSRWITRVRLTLDGGEPAMGGARTADDPVTPGARSLEVDLGEASRSAGGERIDLGGAVSFRHLRIEVLADNLGPRVSYIGMPGLGFAEVAIPGVEMGTTVRMPTSLSTSNEATSDQRWTVIATRDRIDAATPNRSAPESVLHRRVLLPAARTFELSGDVRLASDAPDAVLAGLLPGGDLVATADRHMVGSAALSAAAAVDGDDATAWTTPFDGAVGARLTVSSQRPMGGQRWRLVPGEGPEYSTISALSIIDDAGMVYPLSPSAGAQEFTVPASVGTTMTLRIESVVPAYVPNYFSGAPMERPAAIVEVGPLDHQAPEPRLPTCRDDLLTIDGTPVALLIDGVAQVAAADAPMMLRTCDGRPVELAAGWHSIDATGGRVSGLDIDRLVLDTGAPTATAPPVDELIDVDDAHTSVRATLPATQEPEWFVLRQSWNPGWRAQLDGVDLGAPMLVDGYATGWIVPPGVDGRVLRVTWAPQSGVRIALWASLAAGVVVLALAIAARSRAEELSRRVRVRRRTILWCALGAVVIFGGLWSAVGFAAVVAAGRRRRGSVALGFVALVAVAGMTVAYGQLRYRFGPGADWPAHFRGSGTLLWLAISAVVATAALAGREPEIDDPATETSAVGPPTAT